MFDGKSTSWGNAFKAAKHMESAWSELLWCFSAACTAVKLLTWQAQHSCSWPMAFRQYRYHQICLTCSKWWTCKSSVLILNCLCVCVCVKTPRNRVKFQAGGNGPFMSPLPTKLLMNWEDITTDHRDVPAFAKTIWWFNNVRFPSLVFVFVKLLLRTLRTMSVACPLNFRSPSDSSMLSFRRPPDSVPTSFRWPSDSDSTSFRLFSVEFRQFVYNFDYNFDHFSMSRFFSGLWDDLYLPRTTPDNLVELSSVCVCVWNSELMRQAKPYSNSF